jgi:hypothetical protein
VETIIPAVLLDANVYRGISEPRFAALLEREQRRAVARYCDPFVLTELFTHLADPQDDQFASCRAAVRRVYRRCGTGGGGTSGIIRDSESRLAEGITGRALEKHDEHTLQLSILLHRVAVTPLDQPLAEEENLRLRAIAEHVSLTESEFVVTMRRMQQNIDAILGDGSTDDANGAIEPGRATRWYPSVGPIDSESTADRIFVHEARTPQTCKRLRGNDLKLMGLGRVELPTSRLSGDRGGVESPARNL